MYKAFRLRNNSNFLRIKNFGLLPFLYKFAELLCSNSSQIVLHNEKFDD